MVDDSDRAADNIGAGTTPQDTPCWRPYPHAPHPVYGAAEDAATRTVTIGTRQCLGLGEQPPQ